MSLPNPTSLSSEGWPGIQHFIIAMRGAGATQLDMTLATEGPWHFENRTTELMYLSYCMGYRQAKKEQS